MLNTCLSKVACASLSLLLIPLVGCATFSSSSDDSKMNPAGEGDGNITVGPDYKKDSDLTDKGNPKGKSFQFSMPLATSKIFPGTDSTLEPDKKAVNKERKIYVYVPAAYKDGTKAPYLIIHDGPGPIDRVVAQLEMAAGMGDGLAAEEAFE